MMHAATRFTGKERDAETGLDYFGARYFSGAQGRFNLESELGTGGQNPNELHHRYEGCTEAAKTSRNDSSQPVGQLRGAPWLTR